MTGRVEAAGGATVDTTTALVVVVEESGTLGVATVWAAADPGSGSESRHPPRTQHGVRTASSSLGLAASNVLSSAPRPFPGPAPRSPARR